MKHSVPFNLVKLMRGVVFTLVLIFCLVPDLDGFVFDAPKKTKKIVAGKEYKASCRSYRGSPHRGGSRDLAQRTRASDYA